MNLRPHLPTTQVNMSLVKALISIKLMMVRLERIIQVKLLVPVKRLQMKIMNKLVTSLGMATSHHKVEAKCPQKEEIVHTKMELRIERRIRRSYGSPTLETKTKSVRIL
jgi:hypothetical protein